MNNEPLTPILTTQVEPLPSKLIQQKKKIIAAALGIAALIVIAVLIISSSALTNQFIPADIGANSNRNGNTEILNDLAAAGGDYIRFFESQPTGGGTKCIVSLHGAGGIGQPMDNQLGDYELRAPVGNRDDGGGTHGWRYNRGDAYPYDDPDGTGYAEVKAIINTAMEGCGTVIIHGWSNGGGLAAALWCDAETFGGRVVGYIVDDPEQNGMVSGCLQPTNIEVVLYWTGGLGENWTALEMGVPAKASTQNTHYWYSNPPEIDQWFAAHSGGSSPTPTPTPISTPTPSQNGGLPATLRIMPLGDSVTDGEHSDDPNGYRAYLLDHLNGVGGHTYDYVGSRQYGNSGLSDQDYEGHSGWCLDSPTNSCYGNSGNVILNNLNGWLSANPPDLVILQGGINDMGDGRSVTGAEAAMQAVIERIFQQRPSAYVVALPISQSGGVSGDYATFNSWLSNYVSQKQAQGTKLYFANTATVSSGGDFMDAVHPSGAGYAKFAQIIFDTIAPHL